MWRRCVGLGMLIVLLAGCETTHQDLLAKGYPPAFADGFDDGCSSGRQAAGVITGEFKKNVPRYLKDSTYAQGWANARPCAKTRTGSNIRTVIGMSANAIGNTRRMSTLLVLIARTHLNLDRPAGSQPYRHKGQLP